MERKPIDWDLLLDGNEHTVDAWEYQRAAESLRCGVYPAAWWRHRRVRVIVRARRFLTIKASPLDTTRTYP